ncbi:uncharacterized protein C8Q71DRAFT_780185 [Rhodofomes roseus]|uniref:Uncharacterized protein n=1 Tax=Rhodofomes roseus TaxID=34475 RepID=A0ABQ8K4G6_9APHY|nr:uncharacterized protein C8Q71DRAFT_780185 [Rhodofomes roseus]KAH9831760.1 hypothetical protein C8Q71DRAFT_780185 [Rhodofomes roseus]
MGRSQSDDPQLVAFTRTRSPDGCTAICRCPAQIARGGVRYLQGRRAPPHRPAIGCDDASLQARTIAVNDHAPRAPRGCQPAPPRLRSRGMRDGVARHSKGRVRCWRRLDLGTAEVACWVHGRSDAGRLSMGDGNDTVASDRRAGLAAHAQVQVVGTATTCREQEHYSRRPWRDGWCLNLRQQAASGHSTDIEATEAGDEREKSARTIAWSLDAHKRMGGQAAAVAGRARGA